MGARQAMDPQLQQVRGDLRRQKDSSVGVHADRLGPHAALGFDSDVVEFRHGATTKPARWGPVSAEAHASARVAVSEVARVYRPLKSAITRA